MPYELDSALFAWEEGDRHLREMRRSGLAAASVERLHERVLDELRRRLGPTFTARELADLYGSGTDWCLDLLTRDPEGWDPRSVCDAAFYAYLRQARDFAGGRTIELEEDEEG